jgi:hypothetical protein
VASARADDSVASISAPKPSARSIPDEFIGPYPSPGIRKRV